jgi:hypothetical protein
MNSEYTICKLGECEFNILIPLMKDCFGMDVNIKYFEWKFKTNPAGFVEGYYALHSSGEIAAYYGVIPELYKINGIDKVIYQSCDTMTHSKHRRKGLFQRLAIHCYNQLKEEKKNFVIGFGGGQSTPGFLKFGWHEIFKMKYYFYPMPFKFLQVLTHVQVEEIKNYEKIEHLTLLSNAHVPVHSIKSAKLYLWRVSNPLHKYKTIAVKGHNGEYLSYLTYYAEGGKIFLFDFYISDLHTGKNLFHFLKSKLTYKHKGIVAFAQEKSNFSNTLVKFGFLSNPFNKGPLHDKVPFIFYALDDEIVLFKDANNWQINSFDHDSL